jgi:uncharacterized protein (DUF697 family)
VQNITEGDKDMIPTTIRELDLIKEECKSMVNKRATASAAAAVVPLPGVDIGADVTIMLELLPAINRKFGLSSEQMDQLDTTVKGQVLVIITSLGSSLAGKLITKEAVMLVLKKMGTRVAVKSVTKFIPFVGQAVSAGISFGAMKYLGNSHIDDCYEVCKRMIQMKQIEYA